MNINDDVIREWFYRLPKGYAEAPYSESELSVLADIIAEHDSTISRPAPLKEIDKLEQASTESSSTTEETLSPIKESIDTKLPIEEKIELIRTALGKTDTGLEDVLVNTVISIYEELSAPEQMQFDENFRTMTVEEFVDKDVPVFKKFYDVKFQEKVAGGIGRGEVQILLGVAGSRTGGTGKKDIVISRGEWEVKELDSDAFRPAKAGRANAFPSLTKEIIYFYNNIIEPYKTMDDPAGALKQMVSKTSHKDIDELVAAINKLEALGDMSKMTSAWEWSQSDWHNWFEGFKTLSTLMKRLDVDIKDTRIELQSGGTSDAFWISPEDASQIGDAAGTNSNVVINVGTKITNVTNDRKIWLGKLKRYRFIQTPDELISELNMVKNSFFNDILGLIYFKKTEPGKPYIGTADEFVIFQLSQGQYRWRLKTHSSTNKYDFLKDQV
jgi:hypothetical protein